MHNQTQKEKSNNPLYIKYENFPVENKEQIEEKVLTLKKPKISEWNSKEVLLPILGKNKTSMLHSIGQLNVDRIIQQKKMLNQGGFNPTDFVVNKHKRSNSSQHTLEHDDSKLKKQDFA